MNNNINNNIKDNKIVKLEFLIFIFIILAFLLSQTIGSVEQPVKQNGEIRGINDLNGKTIGALQDEKSLAYINNNIEDAKIFIAQDYSSLINLLIENKLDAFAANAEDGAKILADNNNLTAIVWDSVMGAASIEDVKTLIIILKSKYFYRTVAAYEIKPGTRIAGMAGTEMSYFPPKIFPGSEMVELTTFTDMFAALESGKADALAAFSTQMVIAKENYEDIAYFNTPFVVVSCGFGTAKSAKGDRLKAEFNEFFDEIIKNGEIKKLNKKWAAMKPDDLASAKQDYKFTGENGELNITTNGQWFPMSYYSNGELTGEFVELVNLFCVSRGYKPKYESVTYNAALMGLNTGTYDFMADTLFIMPERLEQINITAPVLTDPIYLAVKVKPETVTVSKLSAFIEKIKHGFEINFIRAGRWKMILNGLGGTFILAFASIILGTLLGALICSMRMSKNNFAAALAGLYIKIIRGVPTLVLLMMLYYVVFNNEVMTALQVCIAGFALDFAAYAAEIFRAGIESVPSGQARAAKALGFSPTHGFIKVVLPQALKNILPVYTGQIIALVKLTSIAGYISALDLTKATDIIRSVTFDAFFPLIITAIIYFVLCYCLIALMKLLSNKILTRNNIKALKNLSGLKELNLNANKNNFNNNKDLLVIEHLSKSFGDVTPLKDVNCKINSGDVISIIGSSGTGKSTFLNLINRLEEPDSGKIIFDGLDAGEININKLRQRIGMVFQSFNLFSHLTIIENIMLAQTELLNRSKPEAYAHSMELLNAVGLAGKAFNYPAELSGGQQQRVAIARTLAMDPEIVLFDEPTSALDPTMVGEVLAVIKSLAAFGVTMLIVTHEMQFARKVSSKIFYMDGGEIYEQGTPEQIFEQPKREKTREFIKRLKIFNYVIKDDSQDIFDLLGAIDLFVNKNLISLKLHNAMLTVAEELCIENIFKKLNNYNFININFEYSQAQEQINFAVEYGGGLKNILDDEQEISIKLLKRIINNLNYSQADNKNIISGEIN